MNKVISVIVLALSLLLFVGTYLEQSKTKKFKEHGVEVKATIQKIESFKRYAKESYVVEQYYDLSFSLINSDKKVKITYITQTKINKYLGDEIDIVYLKENPNNIVLAKELDNEKVLTFLFWFGIGFMLLAVFFWFKKPKGYLK